MWKNPASLPVNFPNLVIIEDKKQPLPKRAKNGDLIFADHPEFFPNTSPEEVLRAGAFGGTYFRPIISAVTNITYISSEVLKTSVHPSWISGLPQNTLSSSIYHKEVNRYGVKAGMSLGMWESSGYMADSDPYGWF